MNPKYENNLNKHRKIAKCLVIGSIIGGLIYTIMQFL